MLLLRAAITLSASFLFFNPYLFAFAQDAGFDVFVTPTNNEIVNAGSNFDILWTPSSPVGPVSIRLMQGATELTQEFGPTIASGIDSTLGKYTWSIPSSYGDYASYGFKLQLDADNTIFQYSYPFIIKKTTSSNSVTVSIQGPLPTSVAVATSTSVLVVTQNTTPNNQKSQTSVVSSNILPSATSSDTLSPTKADSSSITPAANSGASSATSATLNLPPTSPKITTEASSSTSPVPGSVGIDSGLSMGAKVGIAIGSIAGVCIIALLAYVALLMRRRNRPMEAGVGVENNKISELGSGLAHEMEGKGKPSELESNSPFQVVVKDRGGNIRIEDLAELG